MPAVSKAHDLADGSGFARVERDYRRGIQAAGRIIQITGRQNRGADNLLHLKPHCAKFGPAPIVYMFTDLDQR
jgi:hypothetical protein